MQNSLVYNLIGLIGLSSTYICENQIPTKIRMFLLPWKGHAFSSIPSLRFNTILIFSAIDKFCLF